MEDLHSRLREARKARGYDSSAAFARQAQIPAPTYAAYENGGRKPPYDELKRIAKLLGTTAGQIAFGERSGALDLLITLKSFAGAGAYVEEADLGGSEEGIWIPANRGKGIMVKGDSQSPRYDHGDVIEYDEDRAIPPNEALFKECLVRLSDGRLLIKTITPGAQKGRFTLISHNAPPIQDVDVDWCVPFQNRIIIVR